LVRKSARKEFELARFEKDPVLIMKMILTSREAILKTKEKVCLFIEKNILRNMILDERGIFRFKSERRKDEKP